MISWENKFLDEGICRQTVTEGFILTQGSLHLNFDDNPFGNAAPYFPSFQLLQVHEGHPFQITDSGRIIVRPIGDERLLGPILRDENLQVYDAASFFLAPYDIRLPKDFPGKVLAQFDSFIDQEERRNTASLVYTGERGLEIDGQDISTVSVVMPSQIPAHFYSWLYHAGRVTAYDDKAPFNEMLKEIGRFDLRDLGSVAHTAALELEERFGTRILIKGSSIK
ncbi:MAG: hypothetical protein WC796_00275 [Candidatus Pacearchaeota archaeon]|jgi:hypothetical protein